MGEMAERLMAHAWKACVLKGTVGSNPTLSAIWSADVETFRINSSFDRKNPRFRGVLRGRLDATEPETASCLSVLNIRPPVPFQVFCVIGRSDHAASRHA